MEPGHEDREYVGRRQVQRHLELDASMEPGHEDREYPGLAGQHPHPLHASMEPGHEDREYQPHPVVSETHREASMEPGHEDREYHPGRPTPHRRRHASMEPGHEDREYQLAVCAAALACCTPQWSPVMKTGNTSSAEIWSRAVSGLNGARS